MDHLSDKKCGLLLVNLGTPQSPDPAAIRSFLAEFLRDHRVVGRRGWWWPAILSGLILPLRSGGLAQRYRSIWQERGSPLLIYSQKIRDSLTAELGEGIPVVLAMTYGGPSIDDGLAELMRFGVERLIVLPIFPQYSSTTTAAVWDRVARSLQRYRRMPEVRFIHDYADHPLFISALTEQIRGSFETHGVPDLLLFSYHGIPQRYVEEGDVYQQRCEATTRAVVAALVLMPGMVAIGYQSRFGYASWLRPYTDRLLRTLAQRGGIRLQVVCPGFSVDCLETLEEIAVEGRRAFMRYGGCSYNYIPALNGSNSQIGLFKQLTLEQGMISVTPQNLGV